MSGVIKVSHFPTNPDQVTFCQYCGERPAEVEIEYNDGEHKTLATCKSCAVAVAEQSVLPPEIEEADWE